MITFRVSMELIVECHEDDEDFVTNHIAYGDSWTLKDVEVNEIPVVVEIADITDCYRLSTPS